MSIIKASESPYLNVEWFSSGVQGMDYAVGKGLPFGRLVELFGNKGASKTSLSLSIIGAAQKQGYQCAYVDAERKADLSFAAKLGVDLEKLTLVEGNTGEEFVNETLDLLDEGEHRVVVLDSVDAIIPKAILEATAEQNTMGAKARLMAKLIRKAILPVQKNGICFILTNQFRVNIMTGAIETTGGKALEYYTAVRILLKAADAVKSGDEVRGITVDGRVVKNQVGPPFKTFKASLIFDEGFSSEADVLSKALELGILTKKGNTVFYGEQKLALGMEKTRTFLKENPELFEEIKGKIV